MFYPFFKDKNINILCLQDTHLCEKDISEVREVWGVIALLVEEVQTPGE